MRSVYSRQIVTVRSRENESTTTISSHHLTLSSAARMFSSSSQQMMVHESGCRDSVADRDMRLPVPRRRRGAAPRVLGVFRAPGADDGGAEAADDAAIGDAEILPQEA